MTTSSSTRTTPRRRRTAGLAGAALAMLLVACGGDDDSGSGGETVEEELGFETDGIIQRQVAAENFIRDCMQAKGFEYIPVDPVAQQADLVGESGLSDDEFEEQFGYGLTTLYEQRKQLVDGPNEAIRNSLSEADRIAYDQTLYGDDPTATFAVVVDTGDYDRLGGCVKEATAEVFGGVEVLQSLQEQLDELDEQIIADPRMVEAISSWSDCMREAGYDLPEPEQVDVVLLSKLEAIVGPPGSETPDYDKEALAELQREEVAMVAADIDCEEEHITPVEEDVRGEYEAAFREENADLLSKVPAP
ncbi:MAG: hypothetical protein AB7Q42_25535 [Acidimicrobiia bacterium]